MKKRLKSWKNCLIIFVAAIAVVYTCAEPAWYAWRYINVENTRIYLLCGVDHQSLLQAGRKFLKEAELKGLEYGIYYTRFESEPGPDFKDLPDEIIKINPAYLVVIEGYLKIEMFGGFKHFGLKIFPEDFEEPESEYADKKIMDGVWYYDDGYKNNPGFEKYIESLRPKLK